MAGSGLINLTSADNVLKSKFSIQRQFVRTWFTRSQGMLESNPVLNPAARSCLTQSNIGGMGWAQISTSILRSISICSRSSEVLVCAANFNQYSSAVRSPRSYGPRLASHNSKNKSKLTLNIFAKRPNSSAEGDLASTKP